MKIEEEIQQKKFRSERQKMLINVLFTASWLQQRHNQWLKPFGISQEQYNLLRILRGMHPEPATVKELIARMIDKNSNASRLVEKLRQKGLVARTECELDRRRVDVQITENGLLLLQDASAAMERGEALLHNLSDEDAQLLNQLLDKMRG